MLENNRKQCSKCHDIKNISEFNKNGKFIRGDCKACQSLHHKQLYIDNKDAIDARNKAYYEFNKESVSIRVKHWYIANKEKVNSIAKHYYEHNKDKVLTKCKAYRGVNKFKISLRESEYYSKNKSSINMRHKAYFKTPIGKSVAMNTRHKRRVKERKGDVTAQQMLELQQNATHCYWCNSNLVNKKVHVDHFYPISKGGAHTLSNLVIACATCNLKKSNKDPIEFAKLIGKPELVKTMVQFCK